MSKLPTDRSESVFVDFKKAYSSNQAFVEANRCLYCYDAPCITACPTSIDIPKFIRRIANDNVKGAAKAIFDANILGMSCARVCPVEVLCVGSCVYNNTDTPPIQIGKLQRYATDTAFEENWSFYKAGADTGKSVALIGGGPASLAAAHMLRRYGHSVTIFERDQYLGGLNTTGVAPYKMKADRSINEVNWLMEIGDIAVQTGVNIPEDVSWESLRNDFDAIFLGFGLGRDRYMSLDNADASGIYGAVDYISRLKVGSVDVNTVKNAIVVGGGNTAIDSVRELAGLGISSVTMVYRGDEHKMSGYSHEWIEAKKENVHGQWRSQPVAYLAENGQVTGLRCIQMDANKAPIAGSEFTIAADIILLAIGQDKQHDLVNSLSGIVINGGKVEVDENKATGCAGVYAGGDCINGGKEVVNAVDDGQKAAHAIHEYLTGENNG
ncbi:MAG: NAD(P)-dependent oxidoreductase [Myxococcota bacterium]|nr:NAD(P)-dependent oxidoreductase [Myxococcota bacterium]